MPTRNSEATWTGDLKGGKGTMKVGKGAYEGAYSFSSRFEDGQGTNPEELAAAAHAGCFSMALSNALAQAGHTPERVHTVAKMHLTKGDAGFGISRIDLVVDAKVPGIDDATFQAKAEEAKQNCPISKLYTGAEIHLDASLEG